MPQYPPAHAQHQRTVPADENGKGILLAVGHEALKELRVREIAAAVGTEHPVQMAGDSAELCLRHGCSPLGGSSLYKSRGMAGLIWNFRSIQPRAPATGRCHPSPALRASKVIASEV